jgi:hypothetical protein
VGSRGIQFHAAPEELRELAVWIANELQAELPRSLRNPKLSSVPFVVGRRAGKPARYSHEDAITMEVSMPKNGALRQSAVGILSTKRTTLNAWKRVSQQVRKMTRAGVTATNPVTGESAHYRQFRFTEGARALAREGIKMLPFAGGIIIEFDGANEAERCD